MRNKLRPPLITALACLLLMPFIARAAEPAPGSACPVNGRVLNTGGPETAGVGYTLVCESGTWKPVFGFNATAQVTKIGNQTCSTNELLKFDGTKWVCGSPTIAADTILESMLKAVNAPTDEYCLTFETTTGDFEWQTCGAGGDNLGNHTATTNINLGANYISRAGTSAGLSFDASNNATLSGDLTISGDDLFMATNTAGRVLIADGTNFNPTAVSGDITVTGAGVTAIGAGKITEAMLKAVDAAADEECLTYETTTGDFEWQACGSTGDNLGNHTATTNINLGANYISRAGTAAGLSLDASNNATFSADLRISGDDLFMATNTAGYLLIADGNNYNPTAMSGDVTITGTGLTAIGANKVTEAMLRAVNAPTDEYCLTYETTTGDFEWQACGGAETDPQVGTISDYTWCYGLSGVVNCNSDSLTKDDLTTRTNSGFWQSSSATIAEGWPQDSSSWYHLMSSTHTNVGNYYAMQFAGNFFNSNDIYYRATNGNGATAWNKVWHAGNDGAGSGLDADTLDGLSSTSFLTAESDPQVGTLTGSKWCTANAGGTAIDCTQNAPAGDNLGNHTATTTLHMANQALENVGIITTGAWNGTYDTWIQGGVNGATGGARNLALLGVDDDSGDTLYLNFGSEYSGGTIIGGPVTVSGALSATSLSGNGASVTSLNASNLASGTVASARLGSGTANATTFLRGDGTWATANSAPDYDSGWVAESYTPTRRETFTHNLGVIPSRCELFFATTSSPTTVFDVGCTGSYYGVSRNPLTTELTSTTVVFNVYSGHQLYLSWNSQTQAWTNHYNGYWRVYLWK